ncbi:dolichol kinase [Anaeramoeba ignava]|uniref:dolichol kinase n=1 Tax=Anaeramoeba ignava TaxID=1746090 RepID=A0A9Q0LIP4_ANAIG|nr:dolichol kinase [Anaeramoeba ignava]
MIDFDDIFILIPLIKALIFLKNNYDILQFIHLSLPIVFLVIIRYLFANKYQQYFTTKKFRNVFNGIILGELTVPLLLISILNEMNENSSTFSNYSLFEKQMKLYVFMTSLFGFIPFFKTRFFIFGVILLCFSFIFYVSLSWEFLFVPIFGTIIFSQLFRLFSEVLSNSFAFAECIFLSEFFSLIISFFSVCFFAGFQLSFSKITETEMQGKSFVIMLTCLVIFASAGVAIFLSFFVSGIFQSRSSLFFYLVLISSGFFSVQFCFYFLFKRNIFMWLFGFVFSTRNRIILMALWVVMMGLLIFLMNLELFEKFHKKSANILIRKIFHLFLLFIMIPGILLDLNLLQLSLAVSVNVLFVIEAVRMKKEVWLSESINIFMQKFTDQRDSGDLILTHIYLVFGSSFSVWMVFFCQYNGLKSGFLVASSGIFLLGVGDSLASFVGSKLGTINWFGKKKTIEGTLAFFVGVLFCTGFIWLIDDIDFSFFGFCLDLLLISVLEALTDLIDNLILPIYFIILLC